MTRVRCDRPCVNCGAPSELIKNKPGTQIGSRSHEDRKKGPTWVLSPWKNGRVIVEGAVVEVSI